MERPTRPRTRRGPGAPAGARIVPATRPVLRPSAQASLLFNGSGRVLDLDTPARTITASAGGNHTHIVDTAHLADPTAKAWVEGYRAALLAGGVPDPVPGFLRRLTIAESAALRGFDPATSWHGTRTSVFRQVGNAVPVPLAHAIGAHLAAHI